MRGKGKMCVKENCGEMEPNVGQPVKGLGNPVFIRGPTAKDQTSGYTEKQITSMFKVACNYQ